MRIVSCGEESAALNVPVSIPVLEQLPCVSDGLDRRSAELAGPHLVIGRVQATGSTDLAKVGGFGLAAFRD